ncbi:hypothetical protein JAAARDRAFT_161875 [Jaapia argillacea MUCL 33604]|uniref:Secreted protein n=1 Tax=Jaapia argillacea MUCL 33604 TaxID=933084 RepID=A0A067PHN6_9AGAM|nr:hypothetical protein JAAARDRAFT_161875 [Jaapia argillacea MUCL 33604]
MMFIKSLFVAATVALSAMAQTVTIGAPAAGITTCAGCYLNVEIDRPNFLSSSQEVSVIIAMQSCNSGGCVGAEKSHGTVLYAGPYNPQYSTTVDYKPPHQNFTVEVPTFFITGQAVLSVTHFALVGAGLEPFLEYKNVTVNIA